MSACNPNDAFSGCGRDQAQFCRDMGFVVGDRFVGDDWRTTVLIEITAIGVRAVLFRKVAVKVDSENFWRGHSREGSYDGVDVWRFDFEGVYPIHLRCWEKVANASEPIAPRAIASGLTRKERSFMQYVDFVTKVHDGAQTSRSYRKATAKALESVGLLGSGMMECADGDGFTIETRRPIVAYFLTDLGIAVVEELDRADCTTEVNS